MVDLRGRTRGLLKEGRGQCTSCASADLSQSSVHLHCIIDGALLSPSWRILNLSCLWSCEEADLASLTWTPTTTNHAEQLYTDAALVLDASTRVAAAVRSGLIDLHLHCVVNLADGSQAASTVLMLGLARKLTLRASA